MQSIKRKQNICYLAQTNWRNQRKRFGIQLHDRMHHVYVLGKTGTGKSTLLLNKILQDIKQGHGICLLDVHGDLIQKVKRSIPENRKNDVIDLDAADPQIVLGYNPLKKVSYEKRSLLTSGILNAFEHLWGKQAYGVKMAHILRNVILTLLDQPSATLEDILRLVQDSGYRRQCLPHVQNPYVKRFWKKEFLSYEGKSDLIPIYNKLGGILSYPAVKRIVVENKKQLSLRSIMDKRKILLVSLPKGVIGSEASYILASLLLTSLMGASFSRIDTAEEKRCPFFIYLDEFQHYTNDSIVNMLSELRKFKVGLVMAHQYMNQLSSETKDAVLGNVGTVICFRLGQADAKYMEKEFHPVFGYDDFVNLPNHDIYLKLMIDGIPSRAFSATALPSPTIM